MDAATRRTILGRDALTNEYGCEDDREGNKNKFPSALAQLEHQRHTQFENKSGKLSRHRRQGGNYKSKSATWRNSKPNRFSIT